MQAPQLIGIVIGFGLVGLGLFFRHLLMGKEKHTAGNLVFVILGYVGLLSALQNVFFSYGSSWNWDGVFIVWSEFFGKTLVPVALAFFGFFYRANKLIGYVVTLTAFTVLMMVGS